MRKYVVGGGDFSGIGGKMSWEFTVGLSVKGG